MTSILTSRGSIQTLLSTEMDDMLNDANVVHASSVTITSANFMRCELEASVSFGTSPPQNATLLVWFLKEIDGTNFEPGDLSITPQRMPDAFFPLRGVSGAQRIIVVCDLPPGPIRPLLRTDATAERMAGSGNTLKIRPFTETI